MMNGTTVQAISTVVLSWKLAALCALRLAVLEDRIEHHAEHGDEDHRADDQHEVVQPLLLDGDRRHRRMQVELVHRRAAGQIVRPRTPAARAAPRPAAASPAAGRKRALIVIIGVATVSIVVVGQSSAQRRSAARNSSARARRSSGRTKRPTAIRLPCARELDQRTVAVRRLDPNPGRRELDVIGVAAERALDRQPTGREQHAARGRWRGAHTAAARRRRRAARRWRTAAPAARRAARRRRR